MTLSLPLFVVGSATFYAVSMIALKLLTTPGPKIAIALLIGLATAAAFWMEFEALKTERLGLIYVGILGAECVIIAVASWAFFGETFSMKEVAGAGLIVSGVALAWV